MSPRAMTPTLATRNGVRARDQHRCQRCGRRVGDGQYNLQHRRPRAAGGSTLSYINQATNLLVLCGSSSTDPNGCHEHVESNRDEARLFGWSVRLNATAYFPESVPVLGRDVHGVEQWFFYEGFDRIPIPEETALMRMVALGIREDGL